ncbi:hypothetical protein MATL_G00102190 [Megalops atlanticus]|uniref:DUF4806 domain-containing protein n=1 Tax=Megalops atlanticus TaxID=7932 RepID=A0A9D3Q2X9_MEGAT|nr:hypothetical protein MATL_G00102190 [Megalops atlanticus]
MEAEMKEMRRTLVAMLEVLARILGEGNALCMVEEMNLNPCSTVEELLSLKEKIMRDDTYRKKLTQHLSLIGGPNPGQNTRRVMRAVASYHVWREFSLKGEKGKRPLLNTRVMNSI